MTLTISRPAEAEARLRQRAQAVGQDVARYVERLLTEEFGASALPAGGATQPPTSSNATVDLLNRWKDEERTDDPTELARRQREGEELMENLDRNRREMEGPHARKLWP